MIDNSRKVGECSDCFGTGKIICSNPDHGFLSIMSFRGANESRCPVCGHDEMHRTKDDCESCIGTGKQKVRITLHQELQKARGEALDRENQLKQAHMMELDAISCKSIEDFVLWRDHRKQRLNQSELDQPNK